MDLVVRGVSKSFGGVRALSNVSFTVEARAIFGLIGPNGAGKSTAFNLVTGVYRADAGSIVFGDRDVGHLAPSGIARAGIARTFQNIRLFARMTVLENLLVASEAQARVGVRAALLHSRAQREVDEVRRGRARDLLRVFELVGAADAPAASLSYGAQRRLEIARAMMTSPKLLLLDEPAAGMSAVEADALRAHVRWLRDTFDVAILLVEHNMSVVFGVCETVHVLDHGETIAEGTPDAVRSDRAVIAAYLGEEPA